MTSAGSPLTLFLLVQKAILFVCLFCLLSNFGVEVLMSSRALFLLLSPLWSFCAPLSPVSLSQDETVGEVSLASAGGLPRCLGDALR